LNHFIFGFENGFEIYIIKRYKIFYIFVFQLYVGFGLGLFRIYLLLEGEEEGEGVVEGKEAPKLNHDLGLAGSGAAKLAIGSSISLENSTDFFFGSHWMGEMVY